MGNIWLLTVSTVVLLVTMLSTLCCSQVYRKYPLNFILLGVMTACMGVLVGFASALYTAQSVLMAAGLTLGIFGGMTILAWTTKTDWTGYGAYLFGALNALSCFSLALLIMGFCGVQIDWMMMLYNLCGVVVFTMYIVYDTQKIIGGNHKVQFTIDDYCFAALTLYLDIVNLFLDILKLIGEMDKSKKKEKRDRD